MEKINLNHLYYFYIVAKLGSIKEASEKLFVTKPTISDQLKLLETYLNTKLFERKNRGLFLNRDGEVVLEYAERIFELSQDLTARIRDRMDLPKRSLDIGISYKMSPFYLYHSLLPLFGHKDIAINVVEGDRHRLLTDLENGEIDLMFTQDKEVGNKTLNSIKYCENKTFAVGHVDLKKLVKNFPSDLIEIPYFGYSKNSSFAYDIEMYFNQLGIIPNMIGSSDDIALHKLVVAKGIAFSILPEVAIKQFKKDKNIVVLGEISELNTSVWGIVKNTYKGLGYHLLKKKL